MKKMIKGVLVNPNTQEFNECEAIIYDYTSWYDILDCETIDIIELKINDEWFDIILDDEGKLKEPLGLPSIVIYHNDKVHDLVIGKVFICAHDGHGNEKSLNDEQIKKVLASVRTYMNGITHEIRKMIVAKYE